MAKTPNYTDAMVEKMVEVYGAAETDATRKSAVEELAAMFGKSVPSIRTKLSQLKVYVKPGKATEKESDSDSLSKADMVARIEAELGLEPDAGKSLKFATKVVLEAIMERIVPEPEEIETVPETEPETEAES